MEHYPGMQLFGISDAIETFMLFLSACFLSLVFDFMFYGTDSWMTLIGNMNNVQKNRRLHDTKI